MLSPRALFRLRAHQVALTVAPAGLQHDQCPVFRISLDPVPLSGKFCATSYETPLLQGPRLQSLMV